MSPQEAAQENLNAFRKLFRRAVERARNMTPAQLAELQQRHPRDLPGSGTMTRAEYHAECARRLQAQIDGPIPVRPTLREAGYGDVHVEAVASGNLERWPALAVARAWLEHPNEPGRRPPYPFLTLCGASARITGGQWDCVGKTMASAVAAGLWAQRNGYNPNGRSTGSTRAVFYLRAALLNGGAPWEVEPAVEEAATCRFLVLDDLSKEASPPHVRAALNRILDIRWSAGKRTVITANLSPDALHRRLDWNDGAIPEGQWGANWRRLAASWVAVVSRGKGTLDVAGEARPFPQFDAPKRRTTPEGTR